LLSAAQSSFQLLTAAGEGECAMTPATHQPINFCPAAACAAAIARLEMALDQIDNLKAEARLARSPDLMKSLEAISDDLLLAVDEARTRLSQIDPISTAGACAQLLAAIRDIRVGDDMERLRARDLEARAVRLLEWVGLSETSICRKLSQTKIGGRLSAHYPASRAISASEIS
jgi:hypothetical protein